MTEADNKTTWEELRRLIAGRWNELTHHDLDNLRVQIDRLTDLVQQRCSVSFDEAVRQVNDFEESLENEAARVYQMLSGRVTAGYRDVHDTIDDFVDDVRNFGLGTTLMDVARHNPLFAMGAAFAAGFLARELMTKRRRRW